ncbi:hypothetical protein GWK47_031556 [Chionoecetes opilio]|uniref:CCHC-type domain-containing protein n=1 Tax=Chionoecetes opilio TaxID=41210 RepID=A0A8J4YR03_CHIOP|nr:hypothetical protein GWK47_031556 [Chionoecetes opilio]
MKFDGYMLLTRADNLPLKEQRAILLSLLDEDWTRVIRYALPVAEDTLAKEVVMAMEAHLRTQRNVLVDRLEFYSRIQEEGETFDDFLCSLKEIAPFCDFCQHCFDSQLRDRVVCGARDDEAVKAMLKNKDLTLNNAVDVCRASEVARNTHAELRSGAIGKVSAYRRQRSQTREYGATRDINQKCTRCGYRRHKDSTACPAIGATCRNCGESGHFQSVCGRFDVDVSDASTERTTESLSVPTTSRWGERRHRQCKRQVRQTIADVYTKGLAARPTPQVSVTVTHPAGVANVRCTPDTGAETTVMGSQLALRLGIDIDNLLPAHASFSAVGGNPLECKG